MAAVMYSPSLQNMLNRGKKRKSNVAEWQNIKSKVARDKGEEYLSRRNKVIPAVAPPEEECVFSSLYRKRSFRSLSPVQRLRPDTSAVTERSVSCSRAERGHSVVDVSRKPQERTLCFSKEYYANTQVQEASEEIQWRENPSNFQEVEHGKSEFTKSDGEKFETLEQYELEAAKPRSRKSGDLIETFASRSKNVDRYFHLQPSEMKPFGSQENFYSPMLIQPTNTLKYAKPSRKYVTRAVSEFDRPTSSRGRRHFSTVTRATGDVQKFSTTRSCIGKVEHRINDNSPVRSDDLNIPSVSRLPSYSQSCTLPQSNFGTHWCAYQRRIEFSPPRYQPKARNLEENEPVYLQLATPAMRKQRKDEENSMGSIHYKASYSDLIKQKLKEKKDTNLQIRDDITVPVKNTNNKNICPGYFVGNGGKSNKMLDAFKSLPGNRHLTTKSKSDILSKDDSFQTINSSGILEAQREFSKMPSKTKSSHKSKNAPGSLKYNPKCEDICSPITKPLERTRSRRNAFEPAKCGPTGISSQKKVYLPSKVKLAVPPCTPRPDYRDCKKDDPCDTERADKCLEIKPKRLPKLPESRCPCVDEPPPSISPKLEKLHFKFEDPPKIVCHEPPCSTERADDSNPYKHKPLRPYMPGECECVPTPPMVDVRLKRLPKCEPEEVCRPPRICPIINPCPERADECYKVVPKKLPVIEPSKCPCIEPPQPTVTPSIKRLNISCPEPERVCQRPTPCRLVERSDDSMILKRKRLPKFVPGDCPCEDRPMLDWNFKRLICDEEPKECVVPDPCNAYPRADWGCWEYTEQVCEEVDEKCIDKTKKCEVKPEYKHPCSKKSICDTGILHYRNVTKRKFSNSSSTSSMKLYQNSNPKNAQSVNSSSPSKIKASTGHPAVKTAAPKKSKSSTKVKRASKKLNGASNIKLIEMLNELDKTSRPQTNNLLFKPGKETKLNYQQILKSIANTSVPQQKKDVITQSVKKSKAHTLTVTSRAISTSEQVQKNETDLKKKRDCEAKEKCKKIKPTLKALICKKPCSRQPVCHSPGREHRPACRVERVPVCCEKEEPPYSAFSENIEESIKPFSNTPQWTCNRPQYGFHPTSTKKEHDPRDLEAKDKKKYSTSALVADLPINDNKNIMLKESIVTTKQSPLNRTTNGYHLPTSMQTSRSLSIKASKTGVNRPPSKGLLKKTLTPNLAATQCRTLATKIFEIHFPVACKRTKPSTKCKDQFIKATAPKITCKTEETPKTDDTCKATDPRWCCYRHYTVPKTTRKPPPFPAFSDCLDEEMEEILTECPLDKEKYLRMQPRFMNPPPKPTLLKPPPPIQGNIDILKEQKCLKEKLCIENEGVTQSCTDFGKPIPLLKTKKVIKEEKWDCKRVDELKKLGRWPPFTLKSSRHFSTSATSNGKFRSFSTSGLNSFHEIIQENQDDPKRVYLRNYHALTKGSSKRVLAENEVKLRDNSKKILPNLELMTKLLKNNSKIKNPYIYVHQEKNIAGNIKRCYTTYKKGRRNIINKTNSRKLSSGSPILKTRTCNYRGNRYFKCGSAKGHITSHKQQCKIKSQKKTCPKFTLNNCPAKIRRAHCHKIPIAQDCIKPFTPYPAYSDYKEPELVTAACECGFDIQKMEDLQPRHAILNNNNINSKTSVKEYPPQHKIDKDLGVEYYKCKHDIASEGQTLDCESISNLFVVQGDKKQRVSRRKLRKNLGNVDATVVEFLVRDHKHYSQSKLREENTSCDQMQNSTESDSCQKEKNKFEELCFGECLKSIPCHLPEEEKYCICKERCKGICDKIIHESQKSVDPNELKHPERDSMQETTSLICNEESDRNLKKSVCDKHLTSKCTEIPLKPHCKDVMLKASPCRANRSRSGTRIESIWQKVVNYFKARPNCPEPGEYRKKALKEKAEKAANAAGLVVLDPHCLPPEILKFAKEIKKDCKTCPGQDSNESKKVGTRPSSPQTNRRNFSTNFQLSRNYSQSISCVNLHEINMMLEKGVLELDQLNCGSNNFCRKFGGGVLFEEKDAVISDAFKMSLDMELRKPVDLWELCDKNSRTYFGYTDIIPSRENILERAWRISIDTYKKSNYPRTYNFFNEFFTRVEKSIKTAEDLEKLKTEDVLRQLDEFLNSEEPKKKK